MRATALTVFFSAATFSAPSHGQDPYDTPPAATPPTATTATADGAKARASQLLADGLVLSQEGDFAGALDKYREAYAIYPSAKLLINIGTSYRALGRQADAAESYERYIADRDAAPDRVRELRALLVEIDKLVAWATIDVNESGAQLRVDGKAIAYQGKKATVRLDPGSHTFVAEKGELQPAIVTAALSPGQKRSISLRLAPKPKTVTIVVQDGRAQRITAFAVGGAGILGVAGGAVVGGLAIASNSAARAHCHPSDPTLCDGDGARLGRRAQAEATASTVAIAIGSAALVAGIALYVTAPKGERRLRTTVGLGNAAVAMGW
jgi:tetratricopeptide (TPR) repeat protein